MEKITVKVVSDEWYPVIEPAENDYFQEEIEISKDLWDRYCFALDLFSKLRKELSEAIND